MTGTQVQDIYRVRFAENEAHRAKVWRVFTRYFFSQWIKPEHTVLDLGAGYCEFINNVSARQKFALDLNPTTVEKAAPDVRVLRQSVTRTWPLPLASLDVVFTSNFFEHLRSKDELQRCLAEAFRALRPGGLLVAIGPNIRFCADVYWDFIDHYLPLSDRSMVEALTSNGFEIVRVAARFLPYCMVGKKPNTFLVRAYLALPLAWRFLGKQFLIVARKPADRPEAPDATLDQECEPGLDELCTPARVRS